MTYEIHCDAKGYAFIRCRICDFESYHPSDIAQRYCVICHQFHDDRAQWEALTKEQATER